MNKNLTENEFSNILNQIQNSKQKALKQVNSTLIETMKKSLHCGDFYLGVTISELRVLKLQNMHFINADEIAKEL